MAAEAAGPTTLTPVVKEGFLSKKGLKIKSWRKRQIVLTCHFLYYFKNATAVECAGCIPVEDIVTTMSCEEGSKKNLIKIVTPARDYLLQADTPEEQVEWVDAVRSVKTRYAEFQIALDECRKDSTNTAPYEALDVSRPLFWVVVKGTLSESDKAKKKADDLVYMIEVNALGCSFEVRKPHADVLALHNSLITQLPRVRFPNLKRAAADDFQNLRHVVQSYFYELVLNPQVVETPDIVTFLLLDNKLGSLAARASWELVAFLARHGARIDSPDADGVTAIHHAAANGLADMLRLLVECGADVSSPTKNGAEYYPLHYAVREGHIETANAILECTGVDVDAVTASGQSSVYMAAASGSAELVEILAAKGADVNIQDTEGWSPLHIASQSGYLDTVNALIAHNASVNVHERSEGMPLYIAASKGHAGVCKALLDAGADVNGCKEGQTALHISVYKGFTDVMIVLLRAGAAVNQKDRDGQMTALHYGAQEGHIKAVQLLLANQADVDAVEEASETALYIATREGKNEIVNLLLEHGADVNIQRKKGQTCLHIASYKGAVDVVRALLNHGGDVDAEDDDGMCALHYACQEGYADIVALLIEQGADVNHVENGQETPLYIAARAGHLQIIRMLVDAGVDLLASKSNGWNALHMAAQEGHAECVEVLVAAGIDVNVREETQASPLYIACSKGHESVVRVLLANKCDVNAVRYNGQSALHIASFKGFVNIMILLLKADASVDVVDQNNRKPLEYCQHTLEELLQQS